MARTQTIRKKIPLRTCLGCREIRPKEELLRIVNTSEGKIMLDPTGKTNGRGTYVCGRECLAKVTRRRLSTALKATVGDDLLGELDDQLSNLAESDGVGQSGG